MITEADSLSCRVFFPSNFAISGYFFFFLSFQFHTLSFVFVILGTFAVQSLAGKDGSSPEILGKCTPKWAVTYEAGAQIEEFEHNEAQASHESQHRLYTPTGKLAYVSWQLKYTNVCVCVDENNEIVCTTIPLFLEFIMGTWPLKESRTAQFKAFCPDYIGQTSINRHKSHYSTQQKNLLMSAYQNILKTHY